MNIAHIGTIALNGYVSACLQRAAGHEAHSYDLGAGNPMWLPWWEDAVFDESLVNWPEHLDWLPIQEQSGFRRPPGAYILGNDFAEPWYETQEAFQADFLRMSPPLRASRAFQATHREAVTAGLAAGRLTSAEQAQVFPAAAELLDWRAILSIARQHDITVLYGPTATVGVFFPPNIPYVAFEHSTLRYVHRLANEEHHLLAAAYRHADATIVTNADCAEAGDALGLAYEFIPHPLNEQRFSPGDGSLVRHAIFARAGLPDAGLLLYAPARHSHGEEGGTKRNDRIIYAFKRYLDEAEPQGAPKAVLVLATWGEHAPQSRELVKQLGLGFQDGVSRVIWTECLPKRKAREVYRAADIVLDQFSASVGSFGTITAEALSCGKPVITYLDPTAHEWVLRTGGLASLPPVVSALRIGDIFDALTRLAYSPQLRATIGAQGRQWISENHSASLVTARSLALYQRVLDGRRDAAGTPPVHMEQKEAVLWP